jgi:hypothetical protein
VIDRSTKVRRIPKLRHHKPSNRAVVTLGGTDHYCGPWDKRRDKPTAQAQDAYDGLIAEWLASGRKPADRDIALNELMLRYLEHVDGYYLKDGKPTVGDPAVPGAQGRGAWQRAGGDPLGGGADAVVAAPEPAVARAVRAEGGHP